MNVQHFQGMLVAASMWHSLATNKIDAISILSKNSGSGLWTTMVSPGSYPGRNEASQAPTLMCCVRIHILTRSPGDLYAH